MDKLEKAKKISGIVFYGIWLVVSLLLWIAGLMIFLNYMGSGDEFIYWFLWGILCVFPIIIPILKEAFDSAKKGARDGANRYTATQSGNTIHIENHPFRGAIKGFLVGIIAGILIGPVLLVIYFIKNILTLIDLCRDLKNAA